MIDAARYSGMIRGNVFSPTRVKESKIKARSRYLPSFPFSFRFANFSDNKGIRLTINNERRIVRVIIMKGDAVTWRTVSESDRCPARTSEITARALAGVGMPLKVVAWVVSTLKTARRSAAQITITEGASKEQYLFSTFKSCNSRAIN